MDTSTHVADCAHVDSTENKHNAGTCTQRWMAQKLDFIIALVILSVTMYIRLAPVLLLSRHPHAHTHGHTHTITRLLSVPWRDSRLLSVTASTLPASTPRLTPDCTYPRALACPYPLSAFSTLKFRQPRPG